MSKRGRHIIKAQQYQIGLTEESEAQKVQASISTLQYSRIQSLMEDIMNKFDTTDLLYRFDTVALDLGVVSKSNYEEEIVYRIEEELTRFLSENFELATIESGQATALRTMRRLEQLEHFLLRGYLPWYAESSLRPESLLSQLLDEEDEEIVKLLNHLGKQQTVRKRLIWQFKDEHLDRVVMRVSKNEGAHIVSHKNKLREYQHREAVLPVGDSDFRSALWEIILAYLFVGTKSYSDKKSFLKYLLERIARKYNLAYTVLLRQMVHHVYPKAGFKVQGDFERILVELDADEGDVRLRPGDLSERERRARQEEILNALDYYVQHGSFRSDFRFDTRDIFRKGILEVLGSESDLVKRRLSDWLGVSYKRKRLLEVCDEFILKQMIRIAVLPWIQLQSEFISALLDSSKPTSTSLKALQKRLKEITATVIVGSGDFDDSSEKSVIYALLRSLLVRFENMEDALFSLLNESGNRLRSGFRNPIAVFLMRFYHNKGEQLLSHFSEELITLSKSQPESFWPELIETIIGKWIKKTGIPRDIAFKSVTRFLQKQKESERLIAMLELLNSEPRYLTDEEIAALPVTAEFIADSSSEVASMQWEWVKYALRTGILPWWVPAYSWETFNTQFESFWKQPARRTQLLQLLRSKTATEVLYKRAQPGNLYEVWKAVDGSPGNSTTALLTSLDQWMDSALIPLQLVSHEAQERFRAWIFQKMKTGSGEITAKELMEFLVSWLTSVKILEHRSMRREFIRLISNYENKISGLSVSELLAESGHEEVAKLSGENKPTHGYTILEFLSRVGGSKISVSESVSGKDSVSGKELVKQLISAVKQERESFVLYLSESQFRKDITERFTPKQQATLIHTALQKPQSEYYFESVAVLQALKKYLTRTQYNAIWSGFTALVLLRMASGGLSSWHREDWSRLLLHVILKELGTRKGIQVVTKYLETRQTGTAVENVISSGVPNLDELLISELKQIEKRDTRAVGEHKKEEPEEKSYRKLGEEIPHEFTDPIFVSHAGLIILAPYLGMLFTKCGVFDQNVFKKDEDRQKALQLLYYAATGSDQGEEHELIMPKLLCGLPLGLPVERDIALSETDKETVDSLLTAVTQQWPGLSNTSIDSLRTTFIQRGGKLEEEEEQFYLQVEQKAYDMLLDKIPWNISKIKLSWMPKIITVTWRS